MGKRTVTAHACSIDGCNNPHVARGYCDHHYRKIVPKDVRRVTRPKGIRLGFLLDVAMPSNTDQCVNWPFDLVRGYGMIKLDGRNIGAHRYVCIKTHGPPPDDKPHAAHSCGNSACVNPRHLRWASYSENIMDRVEHNTHTRGERHYNSRLTETEAAEILVNKDGLRQNALAALYGVSRATVSAIQRGENWGWLSVKALEE